MCSDKTDIDHTVLKNDDHYDSILISFDIEHNSIVRNKAGVPVYLLISAGVFQVASSTS